MRRFRLIDIELYIDGIYIDDVIKESVFIEENQSISNGIDIGSGVAGSISFNIYDGEKKLKINNLKGKPIYLKYTLLNGLNGKEITNIKYMVVEKIRRNGVVVEIEGIDQHSILQKPLIELIGGEVEAETSLIELLEVLYSSTGISYTIINKTFYEEVMSVLRENIKVNKEQTTGYNVFGAVASINGGIFRSKINERAIEIINMKDLIDESKKSFYYHKDEMFIDVLIGEPIKIGGINYNGERDIGSGDVLTIPQNFFIEQTENKEEVLNLIYKQLNNLTYRSVEGNVFYEPDMRAGMFIGSQEYKEPIYLSKVDGIVGGKFKVLSEAMSLKDNELFIPERVEEIEEEPEPEPEPGGEMLDFTLYWLGVNEFTLEIDDRSILRSDPIVHIRLDNLDHFFVESKVPVVESQVIDEEKIFFEEPEDLEKTFFEKDVDKQTDAVEGVGITPEWLQANFNGAIRKMKEIGDKEKRRVYIDEILLDIFDFMDDVRENDYKNLIMYENGSFWIRSVNKSDRRLSVPYRMGLIMIMPFEGKNYTQTFYISPVDKNNKFIGGFQYYESITSSPLDTPKIDRDYVEKNGISLVYINDKRGRGEYKKLKKIRGTKWNLIDGTEHEVLLPEPEDENINNDIFISFRSTKSLDDVIFASNLNTDSINDISAEIKDISQLGEHEEVLLWQRSKSRTQYSDIVIRNEELRGWKTWGDEVYDKDYIISLMIEALKYDEDFKKRSVFRFYEHKEYFDRGFLYQLWSPSVQAYATYNLAPDDGLYGVGYYYVGAPLLMEARTSKEYRKLPLSERQEISEGLVDEISKTHNKVLYKGDIIPCSVSWNPGFWDKDDPHLIFDWNPEPQARTRAVMPPILSTERSLKRHRGNNIPFNIKPLVNEIGAWQGWRLKEIKGEYIEVLLNIDIEDNIKPKDIILLVDGQNVEKDISIEDVEYYDKRKNTLLKMRLKNIQKYDIMEVILKIKTLSIAEIENIKNRR